MNRRRGAGGFSLAEALVALTLLSSSLATTALTLVQALRHEHEAACRSAAVRLASSLAEQLRLLQRRDGRPLQAVAAPGETAACNVAADCTVESDATRALAAWRDEVAAGLPEGSRAQVDVLTDAPPAYLIRIDWPDRGSPARSALRLAVEP
jgi:Tfp pilus assembly protein PilV